jgi:thioredoxin reductase (NADPH)
MSDGMVRDNIKTDTPGAGGSASRYEQTYPTLTARDIERLRRFGETKRYADRQSLFEVGKATAGMFVVLSGHVCITQRDGLGHVTPVVEQGPGQFLAEVGQLSGRAPLVDGYAEGEVEVLVIPPENLRRLLIAEAELGERIMRALILRRVNLIQSGTAGPVLIGASASPNLIRLQGFLTRNGFPHHLLDPDTDPEAASIIERTTPLPDDLPLVICLDGTVLRNPGEVEFARALGMIKAPTTDVLFDVAVVGSGPAGLATSVYGGSEGLSIVCLDARAFGGQAGASARIENYLGFPTGISGQALMARAFLQAQKFGTEMVIPGEVKLLDCSRKNGAFALTVNDGVVLHARSVVIATGARYRRPKIDGLADFEGRGVWYWASPIEARLSRGEEVILVGGGNSAGQAAVFLADYAKYVRMMVRGEGLAASMSHYLIERIGGTPNIELLTRTEIVGLEGTSAGLERVRWRDGRTGQESTRAIRNVFLFLGADPATDWLAGCGVETDRAGFVVTGGHCSQGTAANPLCTSVPGVFAAGDVRSASVKRVGAAIGEGAQVVAALHRYLAAQRMPAMKAEG